MGYDAIQAVFIAMQMIAIDLYASPYHAARTLKWDRPEAGNGFPLREQAT